MEKSDQHMDAAPISTAKKSFSLPNATKDQSNTVPEIIETKGENENSDSIPKITTQSNDIKKSNITSLLLNNESTAYKELIIKELKINPSTDEYNTLQSGKDEDFNNFVKIKIINKAHELEQLKSKNLDKLNLLLDKCLKSNKLDNITLNNIFNFINNDNNINNNSNNPNTHRENNNNVNVLNRSPSPLHASTSNSSLNPGKKRKLDVPPPNISPKLASPRGHRRFKSEIPSINEMSFQAYSPSNSSYGQTNYPLQPYQLPAPSIAPNNQQQTSTQGWQPNSSYPYPYGQGYSNDPQSQNRHQPGASDQAYFHPQATPMGQPYPSQSYGNLPNRQMLMVPQSNNENLNPNENNLNDNPYFNIPPKYPNPYPQQSLGPPAPQASPYRQTQSAKSLRMGHRRSQSATVTLASHNNSGTDFRSPQIFSNQKPVNFLIHTPKHPPPS